MKTIRLEFRPLPILSWLLIALTAAGAAHAASGAYRLGVGDIIDVKLIQPEEISITMTIGPDGDITFPYVGSLRAAGKTVFELQTDLQEALAGGYMRYPVFSVALNESKSMSYFVYGQVEKPGKYPLDRGMTVLKGLATAGGLTKFGSPEKVKVLRRRASHSELQVLPIDIQAIVDGDSQSDIPLEPEDVVVVPMIIRYGDPMLGR